MSFQQTIVVFCSTSAVLVTGLFICVMACRITDKRMEADIEKGEERVRFVRFTPSTLSTEITIASHTRKPHISRPVYVKGIILHKLDYINATY